MTSSVLRRIYAFSDTYGRSKNPFTQDDADALISTDLRSFPLEYVRRDFDIYGREDITAYILRTIFALHDYVRSPVCPHRGIQEEFDRTITGVFINAAPRVSKENGEPFYIATGRNIRIVTTDLAGLATVKDRITSLAHLPNTGNELYGPTEQFRSSYAACLLHPDHKLSLVQDDPSIIPDYPIDRWELSYVDRFGNIVTYTRDSAAKWAEVERAAAESGNSTVKLIIGNVSQRVSVGTSLRDADPGSLVIYRNEDIDVLRKWLPDEDSYTRLYKSAYFAFSKPEIGAKVRVWSPDLGAE